MLNRNGRSLLLLPIALVAARGASAEGRILLQNSSQAAAAVSAGKLNPVNSGNSQSITTQGQFSTTPVGTTTVNTSVTSGSFATSTAPAGGANGPTSGGYYYAYGVDPNLENFGIDIEFFIPELYDPVSMAGIQNVGIALNDTDSHTRLWRWDTGALKQGVNDFAFDFSLGQYVPGVTSYFDNGLDLTHVDQVQFSYDGTVSSVFPPDPAGNTTLWTQTNHIVVTPEPGAALSLTLGALTLAGWAGHARRRRTTRAV